MFKIKTYFFIFCTLFILNNTVYAASISDSRYNLADYGYVTRTKDQEDTESCWTFAANASIESNLLKKGIGNYDLSEAHMEIATQSKFNNNRNTFSRTDITGGNYLVSATYIMNGWGPIYEKYLPFSKLIDYYNNETRIYASDIVNRKPDIDVDSIMFLNSNNGCSEDITKDIKQYIIDNGAIATYLYVKNTTKMNAYLYYNGNEVINHAVAIIGWDDTISRDNFSSNGVKPSRDGAWIIKNSYGLDYYQYVSYDDVNICNDLTGFFDTSRDVLDNAYNYASLGPNSTLTINTNELYLLSHFTKNSISNDELLEEVSMYFTKKNQKYELYFANGIQNNINNFKKVASGITKYVGYKTIRLATPQTISNNFSIIIKLLDDEDISYKVSRPIKGDNYGSIKLISDVQYISTDGINYRDTTKEGNPYNLTLTAYTKENKKVYTEDVVVSSSLKKPTNTKKEEVSTPNIDEPIVNNPNNGYNFNPFIILILLLGLIILNKNDKRRKLYKI